MQHFLEKWDSYLGKLFGIALTLIALTKTENPQILLVFKYFVFFMIGVGVFDIIANWGQHESPLWHAAAVLSNIILIASCILILKAMFGLELPVELPPMPLLEIPNLMLYLGIFLIVENSMWTWVYDHL